MGVRGIWATISVCCPVDKIKRRQTQSADANTTSAERFVQGTKATRSRLRKFQIGGMSARALERLLERYKALGITTILLGSRFLVRSIDLCLENRCHIPAYIQKLRDIMAFYIDYRDRVPMSSFSQPTTHASGFIVCNRFVARSCI
jgi:hypothetical protein